MFGLRGVLRKRARTASTLLDLSLGRGRAVRAGVGDHTSVGERSLAGLRFLGVGDGESDSQTQAAEILGGNADGMWPLPVARRDLLLVAIRHLPAVPRTTGQGSQGGVKSECHEKLRTTLVYLCTLHSVALYLDSSSACMEDRMPDVWA